MTLKSEGWEAGLNSEAQLPIGAARAPKTGVCLYYKVRERRGICTDRQSIETGKNCYLILQFFAHLAFQVDGYRSCRHVAIHVGVSTRVVESLLGGHCLDKFRSLERESSPQRHFKWKWSANCVIPLSLAVDRDSLTNGVNPRSKQCVS